MAIQTEWTRWPIAWSAVWVGVLTGFAVGLLIGLLGFAFGAHESSRYVDWKEFRLITLIFSASRFTYGSRERLTSTTRPSAGESTARGSSGTSRAGSRKTCRMKSSSSQNGTDQPQPSAKATSSATTAAMPRNGQPSRAMIGCG